MTVREHLFNDTLTAYPAIALPSRIFSPSSCSALAIGCGITLPPAINSPYLTTHPQRRNTPQPRARSLWSTRALLEAPLFASGLGTDHKPKGSRPHEQAITQQRISSGHSPGRCLLVKISHRNRILVLLYSAIPQLYPTYISQRCEKPRSSHTSHPPSPPEQ